MKQIFHYFLLINILLIGSSATANFKTDFRVTWGDGSQFQPDFVQWSNGDIIFRQGAKFWPDRQVEISVGEFKAKTKIKLGEFGHRARVSFQKPGQKNELPKNVNAEKISGTVNIGSMSEVALSFSINLTITAANNTYKVVGQGFAGKKEIKLTPTGHVDLTHGSFDLFRYLTKQYLKTKHKVDSLSFEKEYELSMREDGVSSANSTAFFSVKYKTSDSSTNFAKLQFGVKDGAWRIHREIKANQISVAHPIIAVDTSKPRKVLAAFVATTLEEDLLKEKLIELVRAVSLSTLECRVSKSKKQGLCTPTLKIEKDGKILCQTRSFYAHQADDNSWSIKKRIPGKPFRLNRKTGELVEIKKSANKNKASSIKVLESLFEVCT